MKKDNYPDLWNLKPKYTGKGEIEIVKISDDNLLFWIFDYIYDKISKNQHEKSIALQSLSPEEQAVYHTWLVDLEVNNGGFNQYLFNTGAAYLGDVIRAYKLIEAPEHLALFQKVCEKYDLVREDHS